ncbi:hypothetical protein QYM36_003279 [Artemia franciscana]|uniref:Endonuclease/exonuclease/phosphatase domain-containing protein n=1 Tax=Artemia franciscana TaxID=6661 RepID=A0AA88IEW7_ARTSF|nr:hypothetical protein QYM36_003279 [Artemia franciscana]
MYRVALILQAHETLKALEVKFCNQVNPFLAFYGFTPHIVTLKQEYNDNAQETSNSLLRQCKCVDYKLFLKEFKGMPKRLVSSKTLSFDLLTIMLVNAQSLCNKITEHSVRLKSQEIELCCITETWSALPSVASVPGYEVYTRNRTDKDDNITTHGGGVGVYIKADVEHNILKLNEHMSTYKLFWVKVEPQKMPRAFSSPIFGILYFPPRADYRKALINHLHTSIDQIRQTNTNSGLVLLGDFNDLDRHLDHSIS